MLACENESVNCIIIRTLRILRKRKFATIIMYEEALSKNSAKILAGGSGKEKTKELIENEKRLVELLDAAEKEYLNQDVNQNLIEKLYDHVDSKELGISPEDIAWA